MDIYAYLKKDHNKAKALFKKIIAEKNAASREKIFIELKQELVLHAEAEHKTFYQAVSKNAKGKKEAEHGDKEHESIKKLLAKLSKISPDETAQWFVTLGELKRIVEHHMDEEEEDMFETAKKIISKEKAVKLAEEMEESRVKMSSSKAFIAKYGAV